MRKAARKQQAKEPKKVPNTSSVRDIISKVKDAYSQTDKKLEAISQACLTKECKLKVN